MESEVSSPDITSPNKNLASNASSNRKLSNSVGKKKSPSRGKSINVRTSINGDETPQASPMKSGSST